MATTLPKIILGGLRRDFERTGLPIHAWRAIHCCAEKGWALPPWVLEYLASAAAAVCRLGRGQDFKGNSYQPVTPDEAARLIPAALGFVRPGFNAFANDMNSAKRRQDLFAFMLDRAEGVTAEKAHDAIADRRDLADRRSAERRLKNARLEQKHYLGAVRKVTKPRG
jgi:hypothetical protein